MAQRQIDAQKATERSKRGPKVNADKDKEIAALKQQLADQLQQANRQSLDAVMEAEDDETKMDAVANWEERATVEQLEARRKFLASQGDQEGARTCDARIQAKRAARDSQLPLHVRMEKAAKETKRNHTLVEGAEKKAERLQKELTDLQEQIRAHDQRLAAAKAELAEAQRKEKDLCEQPVPIHKQPKEPGAGSFDGAVQSLPAEYKQQPAVAAKLQQAEQLLQEVLAGAPREAVSVGEPINHSYGSHGRDAGRDAAAAGAERRTSSMPAQRDGLWEAAGRRSRSPARDLRYAGRRPDNS